MNELRRLANEMRIVAAKMGPIHSWWDVIFDIEAFLSGRPTILNKTHDEWMEYARALLRQTNQTR